MYNVNDTVIYSHCGVCRIDEIAVRDFSGEPAEYYVLRPVSDNKNTFYVPVNNENLTAQMRRILSREEIDELIRVMPDENFIWIEDEFLRREEYRKILKNGDRHELVKLIKTLYIHQQNCRERKKKLHAADENFLKSAENLLYDEFAYVLGIEKSEVLPYIKQHI
ncbi:MAG: transcriptional regulator [Ruminococcus sp.]|nr:transcriptional regulator [Ruminococcus sp.]